MNSFQLALRVLRTDGRTRVSAILIAVGVAVATALVLLLVALPGATETRADRAAWQQYGELSEDGASLKLAVSDDVAPDGREIQRVDVAALADPTQIDLPPGIDRLPAPGETLLSPELADVVDHTPGSQLGERFGEKAGVLGDDALEYPEQLVALVGHTPGDLPGTAMPQDGFNPSGQGADPFLGLLAGVGVVVLTVPSMVLVASSARLIAARRERRLAAFRLAGATPRQVIGMVTAETAIAAAGGALLGWAVSPLLWQAATVVPWNGGTWQAADFVLGPAPTVAIVVGVPVLVLLAAVLGLRRVLSAPLGAAGGHTPKPLRWWRLVPLPVSGALFAFLVATGDSQFEGTLLLLSMAMVIGSLTLAGPWITAAIGGLFVRRWRKPSALLAGRRLRDDPRGAYRATAGVVLAVFTGSMALTVLPSIEGQAGALREYADGVLYVETDYDSLRQIAADTNDALARYGQDERAATIGDVFLGDEHALAKVVDCDAAEQLLAVDMRGACEGEPGVYTPYPGVSRGELTVSADFDRPGTSLAADVPVRPMTATSEAAPEAIVDSAVIPSDFTPSTGVVAVPSTPVNVDVVRTALASAADGLQVQSRQARLAGQNSQLDDLQRVTVIGLIVAAVLGGCSAAVSTAGSVLDRRRTFGALMAAGTPVRVLARALRAEAALPALVATVGAGVAGTLVGIGLFAVVVDDGARVLTPWLAAPVVLGIGVALIASSVCSPALRRVQAEPLADE
ncbi:FtsX-like permease family protein [Prauserella aidingensis]|uniref:FtsX-like permease family protein n=1 Tax=Prauserella aidingensis TaxID=387890 RepID=UPI0020A53416|nr:FtsX-like permease family protein [Prauserella aidingensis]MCP2255118.1 FtsX-like permease family protein [Prauserella aidingensis]